MKFKKSKILLCTLSAVFLSSAFAVLPASAKTGFDPQALFNHYQSYGMAEGRFPNMQAEWRDAAGIVDTEEDRTAFLMTVPPSDPDNAQSDLPKMDPVYYYNTYADVAELIGEDPTALLNHYFAYGYSEGRLPFYGAEPCTEIQTSF